VLTYHVLICDCRARVFLIRRERSQYIWYRGLQKVDGDEGL